MKRLGFAALVIAITLAMIAGATVFLTKRPIDLAGLESDPVLSPGGTTTDVTVSFSILPTATLTVAEGVMFEGGSWFAQRRMDHSAVLICHPQGLIIFDTGLGRNIDNDFSDFPLENRLALSYEKLATVADVIAMDDPCPTRPRIILPSHLHWDHAGGIEDFPDAEVWVRAEELGQARIAGTEQGFLPGQIDAPTIDWRPFTLSEQAYEHYHQSLDVFGDGSLVIVPMAGHTAGSVGLFITAGGARYFFTGDTTWALEGFTRPAHKFFAARAMADLDLALLEAEIAGVYRLMARDRELIVIPAHDTAAYPTGAIYPGWIGTPQ